MEFHGSLKVSPLFYWDPITSRFRWQNTQRFVSNKQMLGARDKYLERESEVNLDLANRLFNKEITLSQFEIEFKKNLVRTYTIQYILGKGGRANMTQRDWGIIGAAVKKQYGFANNFLTELAAGRYTTEQVALVANRMGLYTNSSTQMFERSKVEVIGDGGDLKLPAYPGDGSSICLSNDRCHWRIIDKPTQWECHWVLEAAADHCSTCLDRSRSWNPLIVEKLQ